MRKKEKLREVERIVFGTKIKGGFMYTASSVKPIKQLGILNKAF
ncbi:MAG: hypothetical protein QXR19_06750 [Candidatus Jordarchaeaceae archaeon]